MVICEKESSPERVEQRKKSLSEAVFIQGRVYRPYATANPVHRAESRSRKSLLRSEQPDRRRSGSRKQRGQRGSCLGCDRLRC